MTDSNRVHFVIAGFPKCGTSALIRELEKREFVHLQKTREGYESPLFIQPGLDISSCCMDDRLNGHKFASYIYSNNALQKILQHNSKCLFVICVRDIEHALVSWWNMHRQIAVRGSPNSHFVNKSREVRDFYSNCSISEYFVSYAEEKLDYAVWIRRLLALSNTLIIVRQSTLKYVLRNVANHIIQEACSVNDIVNRPTEDLEHETNPARARKQKAEKLLAEGLTIGSPIRARIKIFQNALDELLFELQQEGIQVL